MLTVYEGRTYEWEPPLAPTTTVTINGELATEFAALAKSKLAEALLDIEIAHLQSTYRGGNPSQARVPKGNGIRSGRWVDMVTGIVSGLSNAVLDAGSGAGSSKGLDDDNNQLVQSGGALPLLKGKHERLTPDSGDDLGPFGVEASELANSMYDLAAEREAKITNDMMSALGDGQSLSGLEYRLKEPKSLAKKIRGDMLEKGVGAAESAAGMWDVNRYTAVSDKASLVRDAKASLAELEALGYRQVQNKNTWGFPNPNNPYQGINLKLLGPQGEQIELQFHTPESLAVKERMHSLYDQQKIMTKGSPEWLALSNEMMQMSKDLEVPDGIEELVSFG